MKKTFVRLALLLATAGQVCAATLTFDFENGVGPEFSTYNSGNLWALGTRGPTFRVSKPADDASFGANEFISGGLVSNFALTGNFLVTVDFSLPDFPATGPGPNGLNESVLSVDGSLPGQGFLVLRYRFNSSDRIEVYASAGGPIGDQSSSLASGRYQIERAGNTLIGRFAPTGSDVFTTLGSFGGYTSPQFQIQLSGVQGLNLAGAARSATALDIAFDNLVVQADGFVGAPPPRIQRVTLAGNMVVTSGTNGIQGTSYYVLTSTNVSLPRTNWTRLATNSFGLGGSFSFTNALSANLPQTYYLIQMP